MSQKPKVKQEGVSPTLEQLKAMAYDTLVIIEQAQARLRQINDEIAKRVAQQKPKEAPNG